MGHRRKLGWIGAIVLLTLLLSACGVLSPTPTATPSPAPQPTRVSIPAVTLPATPTPTPAPEPTPDMPAVTLTLRIAEIPEDLPKYDRGDWRHWLDADRDCQNARHEVLAEESLTPVTFKTEDECRVASGSWVGPYTGIAVTDPAELDIDHMVPLANAHRSGGWAWDEERKAAYANSLDYAGHLIASIRSANQAKSAHGPENWRPPNESYWCNYAIDWITIKNHWDLTATNREADALRDMLRTCAERTVLVDE